MSPNIRILIGISAKLPGHFTLLITQTEAKELALTGLKVSHRYFQEEEYLTTDGTRIVDEKGYHMGHEFWDLRSSEEWQRGWFLKH